MGTPRGATEARDERDGHVCARQGSELESKKEVGLRTHLRKRRALCMLQPPGLHVGLSRFLRVAFKAALRFRRLWRTGRFAPAASCSSRVADTLGDRCERARLGGCN